MWYADSTYTWYITRGLWTRTSSIDKSIYSWENRVGSFGNFRWCWGLALGDWGRISIRANVSTAELVKDGNRLIGRSEIVLNLHNLNMKIIE